MSTMVVYESMWGNTLAVAEAIGAGLGPETMVVEVNEAPVVLPPEIALLVVGGPTHAFSMSRPQTRQDAVNRGADAGHQMRGIREWLSEVTGAADLAVATFDTRVSKVRHLPGSAARAARRAVAQRRLGSLLASKSFYVTDLEGPLVNGELGRAEAWGRQLATREPGHTGAARR